MQRTEHSRLSIEEHFGFNTSPAEFNPLVTKHQTRIAELRNKCFELQSPLFQYRLLETETRNYAEKYYEGHPKAQRHIYDILDVLFADRASAKLQFTFPQQTQSLLAHSPCIFSFLPGLSSKASMPQYDIVQGGRYSTVQSRSWVSLPSSITLDPATSISTPFVVANMRASIGEELAKILINMGMIPIFHRFKRPTNPDNVDSESPTVQTQGEADQEKLRWAKEYGKYSFFSCGVHPDSVDFAKRLIAEGAMGICVDVAIGNSDLAVATVLELREFCDRLDRKVSIIAGNIDSAEGYLMLALAGADCIKVGIGPGSACTTRKVTKAGRGQGSALIDAFRAQFALGGKVAFMTDGGIEAAGDALTAIALGANAAMVGKLFQGCLESAALKKQKDGKLWAYVFGEASRRARLLEDGYVKPGYAFEGKEGWIEVTGKFEDLIMYWTGELKNALPYYNARDFRELRQKFCPQQQLCDLILGGTTGLYKASNGTARESGTRI